MNELTNLKPAEVFCYFDKICSIPHGSGNTKAISDYCAAFADEHGLRYIQDPADNIIIFKDGTAGYENSAPVIIQGHLDMVCEKDKDCTIDMEKEGIQPVVDGDFITARGTTLGGDDGIAVAYVLAILASDSISHPPIEAVLTSGEEIGLLGATALDAAPLKGRIMLNLDSEEEGSFLISCAGGIRVDCITPVKHMVDMAVRYDVTISGLSGGHSGTEINRWGANSNILAGRLLYALDNQTEFWISDIKGGLKDNAIPIETDLRLYVTSRDCEAFEETIRRLEAELQNEYAVTDPGLKITFKRGPEEISHMLDTRSTGLVTFLLMNYPCGVQRMSSNIPGLVETSLNPGILYMTETELHCSFSIRSSVSSAKEALVDKLVFLTEFTGGTCSFSGDYPAWEYRQDSPLRDLVAEVYRDMYQKDCRLEAIHAGVECGIFSSKLPGLDCVSYGPDMFDIHTTRERLSISSVQRVWEFTLELLKRLK
ncbi:MAG: aminoacyl-histidine dipeptidase [Lachnospiraceae bacterium]|nr:aminoacyl-histidine dipeptidase [Lachnospiraceae bacterium]